MSFDGAHTPSWGQLSKSVQQPIQWNNGGESAAVEVITVTSTAEAILNVQEARSAAELDAPPLNLPHVIQYTIPANKTKRVIIITDPSLPVGRAWLVPTGADGDFHMAAGRRSGS